MAVDRNSKEFLEIQRKVRKVKFTIYGIVMVVLVIAILMSL